MNLSLHAVKFEDKMADSVDDFKSSRSIQGCTRFPNFEMLDARIVSDLNKIIQNSNSKKKVSLEEQKTQREDRFLRGRKIAYMIYDYFRVSGANDSVENYADLFIIVVPRNDDIQEFDSKWKRNSIVDDTNPIWWHLGNFAQIQNTRVWETQDRIGITLLHLMTSWKVCTSLEYVSLINSAP